MHDRRLPAPQQQGADYVTRQMQKIEAALALIDKSVAGTDFVHGEKFSLGDVVCGTALGYLDRVLPEFDWRGRYANVKRYGAKLASRPAFRDDRLPHRGEAAALKKARRDLHYPIS